jgi:hypothetical protein
METYGDENPQPLVRSEPRKWSGRSKNLLLNSTGWKATKSPAAVEVFLLTSPFVELIRWDEKAGLRGMRYAPSGSTCSRHREKETGNAEA